MATPVAYAPDMNLSAVPDEKLAVIVVPDANPAGASAWQIARPTLPFLP